MYFEDTIDEAKYCGHLFGLGSSIYQNGTFGSWFHPSSLVFAYLQPSIILVSKFQEAFPMRPT